MDNRTLEEQADAILAEDIAENGFDGTILLDHHLRRRLSKEVKTGEFKDSFHEGSYNRVASPHKAAEERRRSTRVND